MKMISSLIFLFVFIGSAAAESCDRSREYILDGLAGDLPKPVARYQDTFKACVAALNIVNVKDAFVLMDGGVAIVPANNSIAATATILAQFCQQFPNDVAKIMTLREQRFASSVGIAVGLSSSATTSCRDIVGNS